MKKFVVLFTLAAAVLLLYSSAFADDPPQSISLLLRYAQLKCLQYQELVHTNSAEYLGDLSLPSTTSYLTAYFHE